MAVIVEGKAWVKDFLEEKKIPFRFVEHEPVKKPVDSARVRKVLLKQIAKALVYMADGKPVLVVLPGSEEVDEEKLRSAINAKSLRLASAEEVKEHSGCAVGLVPPLVPGIRKVVDMSLKQSEEVSFNAGIATAGIIIKLGGLLKALDSFEEASVSAGRVMIGLECHVQLNTASKLFCGCPTIAEEPNSACCPVCLGHPGSKPVLNAKALDYALKVALAFNCEINKEFFFSRKTYFYPDMSKNFQITQYEVPIGMKGFVMLGNGKRVGITRVHLEEDPAALVHEAGMSTSNFCLVDYNRSGIPLVEIVTEPDMESPEEARDFLDQLTTILSYLKVYSPTKGTLKADCNVSVYGNNRVEVKNVSGKKAVEKALAFEVARQKRLLLDNAANESIITQEVVNGLKRDITVTVPSLPLKLKLQKPEIIARETRAFDEAKGTTRSTRSKETEEDYGYITEPDLTVFKLSEEDINSLKESLPELHQAKAKRLKDQYDLDEYTARVLTNNLTLGDLFEDIAKKGSDPKIAAKFLTRELMAVVHRSELDLEAIELDYGELNALFELFMNGALTEKIVREAIIAYLTDGIKPTIFIEKHGLIKDLTEVQIDAFVEEVLARNKQAVADLKRGQKKSLNFLVGQVMKLTRAKADPKTVQNIILKKIKVH